LSWGEYLGTLGGLSDHFQINGAADLYTGSLRAQAISEVATDTEPGSYGKVSAQLSDLLTIKAPPALLASGFDVKITTTLSGGALSGGGFYSANFVFYTYTPASTLFGQLISLHPGEQFATNTVFVDSQYRDITLFAALELDSEDGYFVGWWNTAQLSVSLPPGVSFTSASGVFLTQSPAESVPEPTSFALLLAPVLAIASTKLWQRRNMK